MTAGENDELFLHSAGATIKHHGPFKDVAGYENNVHLSKEFIEKWVIPFYLIDITEWGPATIDAFPVLLNTITKDVTLLLLGDFNWRSRIVGAYFAAIKGYADLEDIIGGYLLKSEVCYAGKGYCVALAIFATKNAKNYLKRYLDYYLTRADLWFEQSEALCALSFIDETEEQLYSDRFKTFISDKPNWNLEESKTNFTACLRAINTIKLSGEQSI